MPPAAGIARSAEEGSEDNMKVRQQSLKTTSNAEADVLKAADRADLHVSPLFISTVFFCMATFLPEVTEGGELRSLRSTELVGLSRTLIFSRERCCNVFFRASSREPTCGWHEPRCRSALTLLAVDRGTAFARAHIVPV